MRIIDETKITSTSAMYFKKGTWTHLQLAYQEAIESIVRGLIGDGYSTSDVYVLHGCVNSGSGSSYDISAGAVFYDGKVYLVDAASFTVSGGNVPVASIVKTQYLTNADPVIFSNGDVKSVHDIYKVSIASGASGSGLKDYADLIPSYKLQKNNYKDLSSVATVSGSLTSVSKRVYEYSDGTVMVQLFGYFASDLANDTLIMNNLPLPFAGLQGVEVCLFGGGTSTLGKAFFFNNGSVGQVKNIELYDAATYGGLCITFTYKKA